jgi:uncharacterized RDD family membrane protein YckC
MENNPYTAPRASLDVEPSDIDWLERRKASRGRRLGGSLIDGATLLVAILPIMLFAGLGGRTRGSSTAGLLAMLVILAIVVINLVLLHQSGQTIGKKMLGTKIVRTDGSRASLGRIILLRIIPIRFLGAIPYLGALIVLVDALMIFGKDVRCLHDQIADTIVIDS